MRERRRESEREGGKESKKERESESYGEKAKAAKLFCDCSFAPAMKAGFPRGAVALNPALN